MTTKSKSPKTQQAPEPMHYTIAEYMAISGDKSRQSVLYKIKHNKLPKGVTAKKLPGGDRAPWVIITTSGVV